MPSCFLWELHDKRYWLERILTSKSKLWNGLLTKYLCELVLRIFGILTCYFYSWVLHYLINSLSDQVKRHWNFYIASVFISMIKCDTLMLVILAPLLQFSYFSGCTIHRHWLYGKATRFHNWWRLPWPASVCWQNKKWRNEIHYYPGLYLQFIFHRSLNTFLLLRFFS